MELPVTVDLAVGGRYLARDRSGLTAEGVTPEEAIANLRAEADRRKVERWKGMLITPPPGDDPWLRWAGTWDPNDPVIEEWKQAVEEFRRERDRELLGDEPSGQ